MRFLPFVLTASFAALTSAALDCSDYEADSLGLHATQATHYLIADSPEECIPFCEQFPGITNWWYDGNECDCFYDEPEEIVNIEGFYTGFCTEIPDSSTTTTTATTQLTTSTSPSQTLTSASSTTPTSTLAKKGY
jgi:hypothetical protein